MFIIIIFMHFPSYSKAYVALHMRAPHISDLILLKKSAWIYAEIKVETYNNDIFEALNKLASWPQRDQLARMRSTWVSVSLEAYVFFERKDP